MNKIKTVGIIGAGAIGAYFVWGLSEKLGENLIILSEGERKERLAKEGLVINDKKYSLNVKTPEEAHGVDLLLVSVKYGALEGCLPMIERAVDSHTVVLSLMNGVDTEEIIAGRIGGERIVYSLMKIASERIGNSIRFDGEATPGLFFGEKGLAEPTERIRAIGELLSDTPLHYHFCEDIIREIWDKFALNVSKNLPQAIIGCGIGAYEDSEHAACLVEGLREEVAAVAAAQGIRISEPAAGAPKGISSPAARYSTLQDIDAKRHTEIDMFSGTMIALGKKYGVPTPYNEFAYHIIKAIEEKNDGKFDYS